MFMMKKCTIIVDADDNIGKKFVKEWFRKNEKGIEFKSENEGCGCCVDLYCIKAEDDLTDKIPEQYLAESGWDESPVNETYSEYLKRDTRETTRTEEDDKWIEIYRAANQAFKEQYYSKVINLLEPYEKTSDEESKEKLQYSRKKLMK
ncbi:MAG: hypothetical protein GY749_08285 [Desulfobacteraceae bacterium]|nr:hypothetical protein [Desulfobacteraceae bacterium]